MNWLDIVILAALVVPAFFGLKLGIIKAVMSLAGVIIGAILASNFSDELGGALGFIDNPDIARIAAYVIILVVVMVVVIILAKILKFTVKAFMLGWADRVGGAVAGLLIGAIFMGALLAAIVNFSDAVGGIVSGSKDVAPDVTEDAVTDAAATVKEAITDAVDEALPGAGAAVASVADAVGEQGGPQVIQDSFMAEILLDKFPLVLALLPSEFDAVRDFFE